MNATSNSLGRKTHAKGTHPCTPRAAVEAATGNRVACGAWLPAVLHPIATWFQKREAALPFSQSGPFSAVVGALRLRGLCVGEQPE